MKQITVKVAHRRHVVTTALTNVWSSASSNTEGPRNEVKTGFIIIAGFEVEAVYPAPDRDSSNTLAVLSSYNDDTHVEYITGTYHYLPHCDEVLDKYDREEPPMDLDLRYGVHVENLPQLGTFIGVGEHGVWKTYSRA